MGYFVVFPMGQPVGQIIRCMTLFCRTGLRNGHWSGLSFSSGWCGEGASYVLSRLLRRIGYACVPFESARSLFPSSMAKGRTAIGCVPSAPLSHELQTGLLTMACIGPRPAAPPCIMWPGPQPSGRSAVATEPRLRLVLRFMLSPPLGTSRDDVGVALRLDDP